MNESFRSTRSSLQFWAFLLLVISAGLIFSGILYYHAEKRRILAERYSQLRSVASLKVKEIEQWREERLADARVLAGSPLTRDAIVTLVRTPGNQRLRLAEMGRLRLEQQLGLYSNAFIVDTTGRILLSAASIGNRINASELATLNLALNSSKPVLTDFFRGESGNIHIDAIDAVVDGSGKAVAAVVLRSNAGTFLYPLINSWPVPRFAAETRLLERRGNRGVLLSDTGVGHDSALVAEFPLASGELSEVQAALGKTGIFRGRNLAGKSVLADLSRIPGTPWSLVTQLSEGEVLAEAHSRGRTVALLVALLVTLSISATAYAYRHSQVSIYRELYESEAARREVREELRATLYSIGDAVITTNVESRVKQMNPVAEHLTGWEESDARGKPLGEIFRIVNEDTGAIVQSPSELVLREGRIVGLANHTLLISRDGTRRPIADSGAPILDKDGKVIGVVLIFRDQTREREAERKITESEFQLKRSQRVSRIGYYNLDIRTGLWTCSEMLDEIFGIDSTFHHSLEAWMTLVHPDHRGEMDSYFRNAVLVEKKGFDREYRIRRFSDGEVLWVHGLGDLEFDERGEPVRMFGTIQDVTERKLAAEKVTQLASIVESSDDAIISKDLDGIVTSWNASAERIYGYKAEEIIGRPVQTLVPAGNDDEIPGILEMIKNGGHVSHQLTKRLRKDGTIIEVSLTVSPIRDANGKIVGASAIGRDITDLRRAEEELSRFFDLVPDMVCIAGTDGYFRKLNAAWEKTLGFTPDEMLPIPLTDLIHPDDVESTLREVQNQVAGEMTVNFVNRYRCKDGSYRTLEWKASPSPDGKTLYAAARDVTERRKAEQALRESEQKFRAVVEGSAAGIWIHDGNHFLYANPTALDLLGYGMDELVDMAPLDIHFPADRTALRERVDRRLRGEDVLKRSELEIVRKNGEARWADLNASLIEYQGKPAILVSVYDITERKMLQEQLLQAQKMEGIGRLAGGIAHDYNNMLGVVTGYSQLILGKLNKGDQIYRYVELIDSAAKRGTDLTRQLLAFARREIVSPKPVDPNLAITSLQKMLAKLIGEDISLKFVPGTDIWHIKIDPTQFDQILVNLATNARDAIEGVGSVFIETTNCLISEAYSQNRLSVTPGEYVLLTFSDDGKGMGKDTLDKIFEPFFTTKPKGEGTGLGLSTVYGIVKQNGGIINVYSEPKSGTTFKIYLPRFYGELEKSEPKGPAEDVRGTETLLVVEDQAELLELAKNSLEEYGYKVLTALTPGEGLLISESYHERIHLLLTDVIMPTMNGKELRNRIHVLKPEIKTIFMSGYTANVIAHRGVLDDDVEFIQKPFTPFTLAKKVREVLDS